MSALLTLAGDDQQKQAAPRARLLFWPAKREPPSLACQARARTDRGRARSTVRRRPGRLTTLGPMGLTRFRHAKRIALDDLLYLATSMSDNVAGDVLFDLVPPAEVTARSRASS